MNNTLWAGAGNDTLLGGDGNDALEGGTGNDLIVYSQVAIAGTASGGEGTGDTVRFDRTVFNDKSGASTFAGIELPGVEGKTR